MRGLVAKSLRGLAAGDRKLYKQLKKRYKQGGWKALAT